MARFRTDLFAPSLLVALLLQPGNATARGQSLDITNALTPAEELVFRSWGTEVGLPQNTVNAIVQTRDGYLWVGTRDGLARFDGVRFTVFGLRDGLPSVEVQCLYEDSQGTLWIGTSGGGLSRWVGGRIEPVNFPEQLVASGTVTSLAEDAAGRLWIGTRAGLTIREHDRFVRLPELARLEQTGIRALLHDLSGGMWLATLSDGLFEFRGNQLRESVAPQLSDRILAYCLLEDSQSNLWAAIGNGTVLCRQQGTWRAFTETNGLPFAYVNCMAQDQSGTVWAGSLDDGLYCYHQGRFLPIRKEQGLSANDIRSLCSDREGILWAGTRTGGLNRLSRRQLVSYGVAQGLTNDYTRSVTESADGVLWVGTIGGGLYQSTDRGFVPIAPYFSAVESVLAARDGSVWSGASRALLHLQQNGSTDYYTNQPWLRGAAVTALYEDHRNGLWIGTSEGLLIHYLDGVFKATEPEIAHGAITGLAQEPSGALWIGSMAGGLKHLDSAKGAVESVSGLLSQSIRTLYLDKEGALWIGTAGGGLSCFRHGRVTNFTAQEGLNANTVVQIVEDDFGFLWLGTTRGVLRIAKKELEDLAAGKNSFLRPRSFGINEGMLAEECSSGFCPAGLKTRAGLICISTVKGLVLFDPRTLVTNTPPPSVLLEEVLVNGQRQRIEPEPVLAGEPSESPGPAAMPAAGRLKLPPGSRELELHYTAICFTSPEKLRFRYRLEDLDRGWIDAGGRRTAYYHHVPPGNYVFRVLACNADGFWSSDGPSLAVTIQPYLWEEGWFRVLAGLLVLGMLGGGIRLVERRRYRHRLALIEARHAVERERLRISQDMHDDIGSVLTQVSQLSDLGQSETSGQAAMRGPFERIGDQARVAVQALDEIVWATNPKQDNLPQFAEYVCRFADEFFERSPIRCWQDVPTDLPQLPLRSEVRHNVFLAIKEAFNNVVKHSRAKEVWLRLGLRDAGVVISVEDNGCGFEPPGPRSSGNGLENMKTRLAECGGQVELRSAPSQGTTIQYWFPLPGS